MVDQDESETARDAGRRRLNLRDIRDSEPEAGGDGVPGVERVGDKLRAARLKRGEDLAQVAETLRIRRAYLEALEEGRYAALPGRTYALGFIRTYGAYLGFDGAAMADAYKQEFMPAEALREAAEGGASSRSGGENFTFPEVVEEARLPRGSLIILFFLLAGAIYGGWYLSISADRMVSERVQPVQTRTADSAVPEAPPILPDRGERSFAGDRATAAPLRAPSGSGARPSSEETPGETQSGAGAGTGDIATEADPGEIAPQQLAALAPEAEMAARAPAAADPRASRPGTEAEEGAAAAAVPGPGRVLGGEEAGGRVIIRALKEAWMRIEDGSGQVLVNDTLQAGDVYRAPDLEGLVLVARDAGAFEILVDEQSVGFAGPSGLVLTGKSLNPSDLR